MVFISPNLGIGQNSTNNKTPKNSIIITPLGDLLNNSKSSIYYRRVLKDTSGKYISLRIGSEILNSIANEYSTGLKEKSSSLNFKFGIEIGKKIGKGVLYFGPEISYSTIKTNNATLLPNGNAIFSAHSIIVDEWSAIDESSMNILSLVGFIGFKYYLTKPLSIGIESAFGIGRYESKANYDGDLFPKGENDSGVLKDLAINRFVTLEYRF